MNIYTERAIKWLNNDEAARRDIIFFRTQAGIHPCEMPAVVHSYALVLSQIFGRKHTPFTPTEVEKVDWKEVCDANPGCPDCSCPDDCEKEDS